MSRNLEARLKRLESAQNRTEVAGKGGIPDAILFHIITVGTAQEDQAIHRISYRGETWLRADGEAEQQFIDRAEAAVVTRFSDRPIFLEAQQ